MGKSQACTWDIEDPWMGEGHPAVQHDHSTFSVVLHLKHTIHPAPQQGDGFDSSQATVEESEVK